MVDQQVNEPQELAEEGEMLQSNKKSANRDYLERKLSNVKSKKEITSSIQELLEHNGSSVEDIILDVKDLAETAETQNAQGDRIADYKTRLNAQKFLLELSGIYKNSKVEIKPDFMQMLYNGDSGDL